MLAIAATGFASTNLIAEESNSGPYIGVKTGTMSVDVSGFDSVSATAFTLGASFNENSSIELEFANSSSGDIDGLTGDFTIKTAAVYYAFRSSGPAYVKGRIGFLQETVDINIESCGYYSLCDLSGDETGLSIGFGGGFKVGFASIELDYTLVEEDVSFIALGIKLGY